MIREERNPEYFEHKPFSRFHRNDLAGFCLTTDLDFVEYRRGRGIVAFIETKMNGKLEYFQREVFTELSRKTRLPFYFITYNEDLSRFRVTKIKRSKIYDERIDPFPMNRKQFKKFMESL